MDRTLFSTAADLETKLRDFQHDFNGYRAHSGLGGQPPKSMADQNRPRANIDSYRWQTHCRGLYQTPIAACEGTVDLSAHALEFAMDTHRGGARRHPDPYADLDATADERLHDVLRPSVKDAVQSQLDA